MTFTPAIIQRFFSKVEKTENCWIWKGCIDNGYGRFALTHDKLVMAHRFSYELFRGEIPKGLQIDHLCRNRACVNPDHLEAVTSKVNQLRGFSPLAINAQKTHCPKGHELKATNLDKSQLKRGQRYCRLCSNLANREWHQRNPNYQRNYLERRRAP